jgi:hypothetical protein
MPYGSRMSLALSASCACDSGRFAQWCFEIVVFTRDRLCLANGILVMMSLSFLIHLATQGGNGANALSKALRPSTHRLSAADARLLEESLRFGVSSLFAADTADGASGAPPMAEAYAGLEADGAVEGAATRKSVDGCITPKVEDVPSTEGLADGGVGAFGKDGDGVHPMPTACSNQMITRLCCVFTGGACKQ